MFPQVIERAEGFPSLASHADQIYGDHLLFDLCSDDDIVALSLYGRYPKLLDWIGWQMTDTWMIKQNFISYVAASGSSDDTPSSGVIADVCADGNGVEWGTCDFEINGFAILRRTSPERDLGQANLKFCAKSPRYRIDKTLITSDFEWELSLLTTVIVNHDLATMVVTGNKGNTPTEFDGLLRLIKYGYQSSSGNDCIEMDSIVVDWGRNEMCPDDGAVGVTVNGDDIENGASIIDILNEIILDQIEFRAENSQYGGQIALGDMILVMPRFLIKCLLDCWVCYHKCGNDISRMDTFEARQFRQTLNGGLFGNGQLLDFFGRTIPIMSYDYGMINDLPEDETDPDGNIFLLTRAIGGQPVLYGELLDMRHVPGMAGEHYRVIESNKLVVWDRVVNMCRKTNVEMRPRLVLTAPWAQASILNVRCTSFLKKKSSDPNSPFYYATKTPIPESVA